MMTPTHYPRVAALKTPEAFAARLAQLGCDLTFDATLLPATDSPLAQPLRVGDRMIGNRFAALPMEGWDGTPAGEPSELTLRRWQRFGASGAKLIWGGEAVAVRHDGRANPRQLLLNEETMASFAGLRSGLLAEHHQRFGATGDLLIGLQLTHSGRFARPNHYDRLEARILYAHPTLNPRFHLPLSTPVLTDSEIDDLIGDFVAAACRAQILGFDFVDIKHCHGYLGHEFLTAFDRPGRYGGDFAGRTRFLREIVNGIRRDVPGLSIGVRLSAFDSIPFSSGSSGVGEPVDGPMPYPYAFGADTNDPLQIDLAAPTAFLQLLGDLDIKLVCLTGASPYYTPHMQRPAIFPPSDGYPPPEDPLVGVARHLRVTALLKQHFPDLCIVGSGYSYLQEWLPRVAQHQVRAVNVDVVGIGRFLLTYPELPADVLAGKPLQRKRICRTFSDCTTAPRNGLVSGCYPLDPFYKERPEAQLLEELTTARDKVASD